MADHHPVFEDANDALKYWTHRSRSDLVGQGDKYDAKKKFPKEIDTFIPVAAETFAFYRLKDEFAQHRESVRAFTEQARKLTLMGTMA